MKKNLFCSEKSVGKIFLALTKFQRNIYLFYKEPKLRMYYLVVPDDEGSDPVALESLLHEEESFDRHEQLVTLESLDLLPPQHRENILFLMLGF